MTTHSRAVRQLADRSRFATLRRASRLAATLVVVGVACSQTGPDDQAAQAPHLSPTAPTRAVTVSSSGGESASYSYDRVGNLLSIGSATASLAISSFAPAQGCPGEYVVVYGRGFAPAPAQNSVQIGGSPASVLWATGTALGILVPAGAATGIISVTVSGTTALSSTTFTVTTDLAVVDFYPKIGKSGTALQVVGRNFDTTPSGNVVRVGDGVAMVSASSMITLDALVGPSASSGKVSVTAHGNTAASADDFYLLPNGYEEWDIGAMVRVAAEGATTLNNSTPGLAGLALFDGVEGERYSIYLTDITYEYTFDVLVIAPNGDELKSTSVRPPAAAKIAVGPLPSAGVYEIVVDGYKYAGSVSLQVMPDASAEIEIDAAAGVLAIAQGQNGHFTFNGTAGDELRLGVPVLSASSGGAFSFTVLRPDGQGLWLATPTSGSSYQLPVLPASGEYALLIVPPGISSASVTALLSRPITGELPLDGSTAQFMTQRAGQIGVYSFSGTEGDAWTLQATSSANFSGRVLMTDPSGRAFRSTTTLIAGASTKIDLGVLPSTGTYHITIEPTGTATGTVDLRLVRYATGAIIVDGPPFNMSLATAQNGRYTFEGAAGDLLGLGFTALSSVPSGKSVNFIIARPDGTSLWSYQTAVTGSAQVTALPVSGSYTLFVEPAGTASAAAVVVLSRPLTGAIALDGTSTVYQTTRAGQSGRYAFTGTAGEAWTLQVTTSAGMAGTFSVLQPSGTSVKGGSLTASSSVKVELPTLPASGTYTVVLVPSGVSTGSVALRLVSVATSTMVVDGPAVGLDLGPAQNGVVSFDGTAGDLLGLGITPLTTSPSGTSVNITVQRPDGSTHASANVTSPTSLQLSALPTTGTYRLSVKPTGTASASVGFLLSRALNATLPADGSTIQFQSTRAGQSGRYTFDGAVGDLRTMKVTAGSGFAGTLTVARPNGTTLAQQALASGTAYKLDFGSLSAAGTYTASITPKDANTGFVDLALIPYALGSLTIGGGAQTVTLGAAQGAGLTFTGATGDLLNLVVSSLATVPSGTSTTFYITRPDGVAFWSRALSTPTTLQLTSLPASGTYLLRIIPSGTASASVTAQLVRR